MKKNQPAIEYVILIIIIIVGLAFFWYLKNQEVNLCQQILRGLAEGNPVVEKVIDWGKLKAIGVDVGAAYKALPNEKEKADYRKEFIRNFAFGFQKSGGQVAAFRRWRVYDKNYARVVVACDYAGRNKTLLFTISKAGKNKLISLEWEDER